MATLVQYLPGNNFWNVNQEKEQRWTTHAIPGRSEIVPSPSPLISRSPLTKSVVIIIAGKVDKQEESFCRTKGYYSWVGNFALTLSLSSLTLAGRKEEALHAQFYISRSERKGEEEGGVSLHFSTLTDKQARVIWPLKTFERMMSRPRLFN